VLHVYWFLDQPARPTGSGRLQSLVRPLMYARKAVMQHAWNLPIPLQLQTPEPVAIITIAINPPIAI
jgi:hypothetical protein